MASNLVNYKQTLHVDLCSNGGGIFYGFSDTDFALVLIHSCVYLVNTRLEANAGDLI